MLGGVTSFTIIGCLEIGGFTRTSYYHDWILKNLQYQYQTQTSIIPSKCK